MQWTSLWRYGQRCVCDPESAEVADSRPPTLATQSRESLLFRQLTTNIPLNHLFAVRCSSIVYLPEKRFTLCPSSSQRIISNRHFPRPTSLFIDTFIIHLPFSSRLIFPYWLVTFVHVHAACTHLDLVYLYQPIVIGEAFWIVRHTHAIGPSLLKLFDSLRHHLPYLA